MNNSIKAKSKIIFFILCIGWLFFISYNSRQVGTVSNTISSSISKNILNKAEPVVSNVIGQEKSTLGSNDKLIKKFNYSFRKFAHIFEFAVWGILVNCFIGSLNLKKREVIIDTLFVVLLYAVIDEFSQLYIVGRSSQVKDILIDFLGGIIGIIALEFIKLYKIKISRISKEN